jgi:hypothetical protein
MLDFVTQPDTLPRKPGKAFAWEKPCDYDDDQKRAFHRAARSRLKALAQLMGWPRAAFDIRANKAGIAVSGEITLHHDGVFIQVSQSCMGSAHGILFRTCQGRKDFTGGMNNFAPLALLDDLPSLAARIAPLLHQRQAA